MVQKLFFIFVLLMSVPALADLDNKGIGPAKNIKIPQKIDKNLSSEGKELYKLKCASCHKLDERFAGPPLRGVTIRRSPEWVLNQIVNPAEMASKDPIAKALVGEYYLIMPNQNINLEGARKIYEYLRIIDHEGK